MFRDKRTAAMRIFMAALLAILLGLVPIDRPGPMRIGSTADFVKEGLHGLISMGSYNFSPTSEPVNTLEPMEKKAGLLQGIAIIATWRNLEPTATSGLSRDNEIDEGLAAVREYNRLNPNAQIHVKIRVWGASWAPTWVMNASGGSFTFEHKGSPRTIGHMWSPVYRGYWQRLQQQLAAKYDRDDLVREVSVTSCMTVTAEPFYFDHDAIGTLRHNGLNDADYKACLDGIPEELCGLYRVSRGVVAWS